MTCSFPGCENESYACAYCAECRRCTKPNVGSASYSIPNKFEKLAESIRNKTYN